MREKITELVELAWDNGVVDYANRKSSRERRLCLAFTSGKIEGDMPTITNQILTLITEEIEKELNGREEDMIADADYKEGWLDCRHWILALLKEK